MAKKGRDSDREKGQGQPEARALLKKVEKEVKKIKGTSYLKKFKAKAPDGHNKGYILLLFVGLARKSALVCFLFSFNDSGIVRHSPFACKWQNKFWDSEHVIACFSSNKGGTSNIWIPCSSSKLHPAPCMRDVCRVRRLGLSYTSKQNVLSLILLISLAKLTNQKMGIYRHRILYPLRLRPLFPNDAQTLKPKASLEPNQILSWLKEC